MTARLVAYLCVLLISTSSCAQILGIEDPGTTGSGGSAGVGSSGFGSGLDGGDIIGPEGGTGAAHEIDGVAGGETTSTAGAGEGGGTSQGTAGVDSGGSASVGGSAGGTDAGGTSTGGTSTTSTGGTSTTSTGGTSTGGTGPGSTGGSSVGQSAGGSGVAGGSVVQNTEAEGTGDSGGQTATGMGGSGTGGSGTGGSETGGGSGANIDAGQGGANATIGGASGASAAGGGGSSSAPAPIVPSLKALQLSHGVLEPPFDPAYAGPYRVRVGLAEPDITVTPVAQDPRATVWVNAASVASGTASLPIPLVLSVDSTSSTTITVTSDSDTPNERAYLLDVDRASGLFREAYLKASTARPGDRFGTSIALSRGTFVVGAPQQDGSGFGVDSLEDTSDCDDCGAAYVFIKTSAGWKQQSFLKASNPQLFDYFGAAVAISGDLLVVGAPGEDSTGRGVQGEMNERDDDHEPSGAAYVFQRVAGHWAQRAYLKASDSSPGIRFGSAVGISGDTIVVGAPGREQPGGLDHAGSAYVFQRRADGWAEAQILGAPRPGARDSFGSSVAISGERLVIGAPGESSNSADDSIDGFPDAGAAYVFQWNNASWVATAFLKAANARAAALFGSAVAIDGSLVAVGAPGESASGTGVGANPNDDAAPGSGAAYVFVNTGQKTSWEQAAYLKASNSELGDSFGAAVAIAQGVLAVGASGATSIEAGEDSSATGIAGNQQSDAAEQSGAVYLFARASAGWAQQAYVKASNTGAGDGFGSSVAVADGDLAVGALLEDSPDDGHPSANTASASGAVYVRSLLALAPLSGAGARGLEALEVGNLLAGFSSTTLDYQVQAAPEADSVLVTASPADPDAEVVITNSIDQVVDASRALDLEAGDNRFTIHVLATSGEYVTYTLNVRRPIAITDAVGDVPLDVAPGLIWSDDSAVSVTVDISGDTLVVGVPYDDLGVDGISSDEATTEDSGAAYVFVRTATGWRRQAYLKASNAGLFHHFGAAVAIDGDTLVVGAPGEASLAQEINGDQTQYPFSGQDSGAAYVFVRGSDGAWTQQAYLKAFNARGNHYFGTSVEIEGERVLVGAPGEGSDAVDVNGEITGLGDTSASGAAYLYLRSGQTWALEAHLKPSNTQLGQRFGTRVAMFGHTIAVTAPDEGGGSSMIDGEQYLPSNAWGTGAVYTFVQYTTKWWPDAYLKAPYYHFDIDFGRSLSLGENTLVVGATGDRGRSRLVNGDEFDSSTASEYFSYDLDNALSVHGSAFVFERDSIVKPWREAAYLKASNGDGRDAFGRSVSLVGDYLVIGAFGESSATPNDPNDNSASSSGAAYLFHRSLLGWSEASYIKAQAPTAELGFGCHVALDELATTLVVGSCRQQNTESFDPALFGKVPVFQF